MNGARVESLLVPVNRKDAPRRRNDGEINCLWASRIGGRIVGLVHLVGAERQTATVAMFRVDPEYRHTTILTNLIDRVRDYCLDRGCTSVRMESHVAPQWVLRQFGAHGLQLVARTLAAGQDLLEFRPEPAQPPKVPANRPPQRRDAEEDWSGLDDVAGELVAGAV